MQSKTNKPQSGKKPINNKPVANKTTGKPIEKMVKAELVTKLKAVSKELGTLKSKLTSKNKSYSTSQKNLRETRAKLAEATETMERYTKTTKVVTKTLETLRGENKVLKQSNGELKAAKDLWDQIMEVLTETISHITNEFDGGDIASWKFMKWYRLGVYVAGQIKKIVKIIKDNKEG